MDGNAFHGKFKTDIDQEIESGAELYIAGRLRYGERLSGLVRRNPAAVWRRFCYLRSDIEPCNLTAECSRRGFAVVVRGIDIGDDCKATNRDILTPCHRRAWRVFRDRLGVSLAADDAEWRYSPANRCGCGLSGREFWPLASAELLRDLGFAVAESLATFLVFHGGGDELIHDLVETVWWNVRPGRRRSERRRNLLGDD